MNEMPGGQLRNRLGSDSATPSELFPVLSKRKELINKGLLIPVGIAFLFGISLTATASTPEIFRNVLGVGIGLGCFYVLYSLGGKKKPWWIFAFATIFTMVLMLSPLFPVFFLVFYNMAGTPQGEAVNQLSFVRQVIARFVSTGMMEELVKIIPVLLIWKWTTRMKSPQREKAGITEPLDGILVGAASALGFVFVETLMQYAPNAVMGVAGNIAKQLPHLPAELYVLAGDVFGLQSGILRILPELSGHMAYSGYFGYFVGLAAMKPKHMWKLLITGYVSAAGLHAIWDLFCDRPGVGVYMQLPMMIAFYAFLVAAILKARQIYPLRIGRRPGRLRGMRICDTVLDLGLLGEANLGLHLACVRIENVAEASGDPFDRLAADEMADLTHGSLSSGSYGVLGRDLRASAPICRDFCSILPAGHG